MNNRKRGDRNERKTILRLRKLGYTVVKSGGSLGMFDMIAIPTNEGTVSRLKLIQVKSFKPSAKKKRPYFDSVISEIQSAKVPLYAQKELWIWINYQREPVIQIVV
jgi:hypothetical protein